MVMNNIPNDNILVCVTDQLSCERLIRTGAEIAKEKGVPVQVVSVLPEALVSDNTAFIMQKLYNTANSLGAEMTFYFNSDPALTVVVHAKKSGATHIVSGTPGANSTLFFETIKSLLPDLPITIINTENHLYTFPAIPPALHSVMK